MIKGTIDIAEYIVDYIYSYTPGDLEYPPLENVIISEIWKVEEYEPDKWRSKPVIKFKLTAGVLHRIEKKCKLDGIKQAISYNEIHKQL